MVDPEVPVGPDVTAHGVDVDSDGRPDTVVVAGLAAPTVVVDVDHDGRGDVVIEVSPAGDARMTALTEIGGGWPVGGGRSLVPDPGVSHWSDPGPEWQPDGHRLDVDADPPDLLDCLLDLFS